MKLPKNIIASRRAEAYNILANPQKFSKSIIKLAWRFLHQHPKEAKQ